MGHIVPMLGVSDVFERKYGDKVEVIKTSFYNDSPTEAKKIFQNMLVNEVSRHNKLHGYAKVWFAIMDLFQHYSLRCTMEWFCIDSFTDSMKYIHELNPDLVFSTHWATSYYAAKMSTKPINIEYCPDVRLDILWKTGAETILIPSKFAADNARKKRKYKNLDIREVPFIIRDAAFRISKDKTINRKEMNLKSDAFTVTLADGGYGAGRLKDVVTLLVNADVPMNIIAICGKNKKLFDSLHTLKVNENINFVICGYTEDMLKYIAASDLFVGKSGASSMAEPRYFGVPMLITLFATQIEEDNGNYYINEVGCALKEFNPVKAVEKIIEFAKNPELLEPYAKNALKGSESNGAEVVADFLFERLKQKFDL